MPFNTNQRIRTKWWGREKTEETLQSNTIQITQIDTITHTTKINPVIRSNSRVMIVRYLVSMRNLRMVENATYWNFGTNSCWYKLLRCQSNIEKSGLFHQREYQDFNNSNLFACSILTLISSKSKRKKWDGGQRLRYIYAQN